MVLSESEAEGRLAALRREREALDRAITDLTLYLELGRRLTGAHPSPDERRSAPLAEAPGTPWPEQSEKPRGEWRATSQPDAKPSFSAVVAAPAEPASGLDQNAQETKSVPHSLSDGALARRYGRALIREAVAVLEAAGRPLHASEILAGLEARGFTIPGQQDPIAALNTRLWKRSGEGGALRRLGDAIYAPAGIGQGDQGEA